MKPATEKQKKFLDDLEVDYDAESLGIEEASDLIQEALEDREHEGCDEVWHDEFWKDE